MHGFHRTNTRRDAVLSSLLAASVIAVAGQAAAQARTDANPEAAGDDVVLSPITVEAAGGGATEGSGSFMAPQASSATGLPLTIRETPQSVSVITDQRIEDQALLTTLDILAYTTGVNAYGYETDRDSTYSRGFWVGNYIIDGMNVPTYEGWFSGVSLSSSTAVIDRVEVLRGAAGLLSGTGEPGATVSITRKRASSPVPTGVSSVRIGSWNQVGGTLDVSTPLNAEGTIRSRFIVDAESTDSFIDRYSLKKQTYYGTIEADLSDTTRLTFSAQYSNYDPVASMWGGLPVMFSNGVPTEFDRSFSNAADWAHWSSWQTTLMAKLEHEFGNGWTGDVTLAGVDRTYDAELLYMWGDLDQATGLGLNPSPWKGSDHNQLVALDASLTGPVQFLNRTHTLNFTLHGDRDRMKRDWPGFSGTPAPIGNIFAWTGAYPMPEWNPSDAHWEDYRTNVSALASGRFTVTDDLHLILGGRYTSWRGNADIGNDGDFREFDNFSPYVGAVYDVTRDWSLYASYSEMFQPQDYRDRNGDLLDPQVGKSAEIGAKGELFDSGVTATFALYRSYMDNVGTVDGTYLVPGTVDPAYRGAQGVEAEGLEIEFAGEIAPGWNLFLGGSTMSLSEGDDDDFMPDQPRTTLKAFTAYRLPGAFAQWTVGGGFRWQSDIWVDVTNAAGETFRYTQPSYTVVDAMARYDFNDRWSAQLNVNNVFDETYFGSVADQSFYGEPLNAVFTVSARF